MKTFFFYFLKKSTLFQNLSFTHTHIYTSLQRSRSHTKSVAQVVCTTWIVHLSLTLVRQGTTHTCRTIREDAPHTPFYQSAET